MSARHHDGSFNATRVARLETTAWTAYYRREWPRVLAASYGLVREAFNLTRLGTVLGAWWVFRANVVWAPYPDNDPDRARLYMRRVYAMSKRRSRLGFDPAEAARLEVDWWRVHREHAGPADRQSPVAQLPVVALCCCRRGRPGRLADRPKRTDLRDFRITGIR